jgi:hypothetical protein
MTNLIDKFELYTQDITKLCLYIYNKINLEFNNKKLKYSIDPIFKYNIIGYVFTLSEFLEHISQYKTIKHIKNKDDLYSLFRKDLLSNIINMWCKNNDYSIYWLTLQFNINDKYINYNIEISKRVIIRPESIIDKILDNSVIDPDFEIDEITPEIDNSVIDPDFEINKIKPKSKKHNKKHHKKFSKKNGGMEKIHTTIFYIFLIFYFLDYFLKL